TLLLHRSGMVTYSPKMLDLVELSIRVAQVDSTVLICGESGVGKELLAKLIHGQSARATGPFVKINCGAIPENLLESELFGYESGAFTGANRQGKLGMFELAHGGTLFLDEIGELPLGLQVKLLRAIQEQEFVRIGGVKARRVDIRFIAATNRDLEGMVETGNFREDLYFRLNVIPLTVPPLRERREDILPLIHHLQIKFTEKFKVERNFSPEVLRIFLNYSWPGNVRELENIVERLFVISPGPVVTPIQLPPRLVSGDLKGRIKVSGVMPLHEAIDELQRTLIEQAIARFGNTQKAAQALRIDNNTLIKKLGELAKKSAGPHRT
ncbi:MAG TPA: sigma 54-interacting transcriptional regulator, partial [Desulfobacteria bacterium]|nr:sigma 54-interacting transcriptional regulator [Desulfobacteria bacterium]